MKKRTWLWVIAGVFGTLFLFVVLLVGSGIYMFKTHVKNEWVDTPAAEQQFEEQRAQFKGQQPLIEFTGRDGYDNDDKTTVHRASPNAPRAKINNLRVLIYDLHASHLIHVDIPGWAMRMMPRSRFGGWQGDDEFVRNRITLEDIERHGLGLVLEGRNRNTRILVWSE
jgi:hypothetical protein